MSEPHDDRARPGFWIQVSTQTLARYSLFELQRVARRSPTTGREHAFLRLVAPDWVNVVAITDHGRLILVEQYRHGTNRVTTEIPGGAVDDGEQPAAAAARELEEETGYRAGDLIPIGEVDPNPAFLSNRCWTFLALGCRRVGEIRPDPSEEIAVRLVEPAAFTRLIDERVIVHALVIAAHDHLERGVRRQEWWADRVVPPTAGRSAE
jgi:8-oxo-dGTP pyrophosphatase MutT (NUDIX family)